MSQHTPGPWYAWDNGEICGVGKAHSNGSDILSVTRESNRPESEDTANMKLIAAAPDLLEALKYALSMWGDYLPPGNSNAMKAIKQARAAIAKARGDQ